MGACCLCAIVFSIALGILNTIIMLVGLVIAGIGGLLLAFASNMAVPLIFQGIITAFISNLSIVDKKTLDNIESGNLTDLLTPAGTALLIVGLAIAIVGAVGYFGLVFKLILKIYTIGISILVVVETICVALFLSGTFNDQLRKAANTTLVNYYIDLNDANAYSMTWNVIMLQFKCCGLDNYEDFFYTKHPYPMNDTIIVNGQSTNVLLETPLSCCKVTGTYPAFKFLDETCAVNPANNISNFNTGCWNEVWSFFNQPSVIVICSLIIIAQGAIVAMAGIIIRESSANKVNPA